MTLALTGSKTGNCVVFQSHYVEAGPDGSPSRPLVDVSPVLQVERGWRSYVVARPGTHPEYQGLALRHLLLAHLLGSRLAKMRDQIPH